MFAFAGVRLQGCDCWVALVRSLSQRYVNFWRKFTDSVVEYCFPSDVDFLENVAVLVNDVS